MSTASERLRRKIELMLPGLAEASAALLARPDYRELYGRQLVGLHQQIRATVPLIRAALGRCRDLPDDPVAAGMIDFLEEHISEEAGHDEWVLEDLAVLGVARADVLRQIPPPLVAAFVGSQYYWLFHHHPVGLLGHVMVREGYCMSREQIDVLAERSGLPREAFRTMERHGVLDADHWRELAALIDRLPLAADHEELMGLSALHTVRLATDMVAELVEEMDESPG